MPILKKYSDDIIVVDGHSKDETRLVCERNKVNFVLDNKLGKGDAQRVGANLVKNNLNLKSMINAEKLLENSNYAVSESIEINSSIFKDDNNNDDFSFIVDRKTKGKIF